MKHKVSCCTHGRVDRIDLRWTDIKMTAVDGGEPARPHGGKARAGDRNQVVAMLPRDVIS